MPNGRGNLECCYCQHWDAESGLREDDSAYEAGVCRLYKAQIPATLEVTDRENSQG